MASFSSDVLGRFSFFLEDFDFGFTTEKRVSDVFGYNWPYDDFSIVEAVKIDIEFEVEE